jgi:hypothetical protein
MTSSLTPYALKACVSSSASTPVLFDEVKFHTMGSRAELIKDTLRNNYVGAQFEAGKLDTHSGESGIVLTKNTNASPLAFIGETMETETALADRYVGVAFTHHDRGTMADFEFVYENRVLLGSIGRTVLSNAMVVDFTEMQAAIKAHSREIGTLLSDASRESRRVFNYAVTLYGLDQFALALHDTFGNDFDEDIEGLKDAIKANLRQDLPKNMSEASKVLDTFAFLSKKDTEDKYRLVYGQDYTMIQGYLDIKLQSCFVKYQKHCRDTGQIPLFPEYAKLVAAMRRHSAVTDTQCLENAALKDTIRVDVYRFDTELLDGEGVDAFTV